MGTIIFYPVTLTLEYDPFLENFNLAYNFGTVSVRALIFHMSTPCEKTFKWVPLFLTLWPWPWSLNHFLKTLTLLITIEQWVLELWYFTWVSLVIRPFRGYHYFLPCDFDLGVWISFESAREARRLLAIICIGFLANHRLCKHPQNQLVCVYKCLFTTFQILFLCT